MCLCKDNKFARLLVIDWKAAKYVILHNIANMPHYLIWSSFELPVAFIKRLFLLEKTMAYSNTLREEELKNKVANDYFSSYDNTKIIGNIDFCIAKITDKSGGK